MVVSVDMEDEHLVAKTLPKSIDQVPIWRDTWRKILSQVDCVTNVKSNSAMQSVWCNHLVCTWIVSVHTRFLSKQSSILFVPTLISHQKASSTPFISDNNTTSIQQPLGILEEMALVGKRWIVLGCLRGCWGSMVILSPRTWSGVRSLSSSGLTRGSTPCHSERSRGILFPTHNQKIFVIATYTWLVFGHNTS